MKADSRERTALRPYFFPHTIQHTIDKLHRLRRRKLPRNFERLINHHRPRRRRIPQELRHRSPQHIPVHCRHPIHPPVLCMLPDEPINLRQPVAGDAKKIVSKSPHFFLYVRPLRPKRLPDKLRRLLSHVRLKEHLQNQFAGFASSTHDSCQPSAVSKNLVTVEAENSLQDRCIAEEFEIKAEVSVSEKLLLLCLY